MTLGLALNNALSGLSLNQRSLSVASNNITNANTEGYTRKRAEAEAQVTAGMGSGATSELRRVVDEFLAQAMRGQAASTGRVQAMQEYMTRIQTYLGNPNQGKTLMTTLDSFFSAMSNLSASPEQPFFRTQAVQKTADLANTISNMALNLQKTRLEADKGISEAVNNVNDSLDRLYAINTALRESAYGNQSQDELLDQRDKELQKVMQYLDVGITFKETGEVVIFNQQTEILSGSRYHLQYVPSGSVETFTDDKKLSKIQVIGLNDKGEPTDYKVDLSTGGTSSQNTSSIEDGRIKALMDLRDIEIPRMLDQLDALATGLRDSVNAIHNDGVGFPPPNSYTSANSTYNSQGIDISGKMMIAVLNADGTPVRSPYAGDTSGLMRPLTLNFDKIYGANGWGEPTMGEIINEINQYYDSPQSRANFGMLKDVQLIPMSDDTTGPFQFDLEFDNAGENDLSISILDVNGVPTTDVFASVAGSTTRTGPGFTYSVAGPGPLSIPVTIQFTDPASGYTYTDTITYNIPATPSGLRGDRVSVTSLAGGATPPNRGSIEAPTTNARIAQAALVDANGTAISPNDATTRGYLKIYANNSAQTIAMDQMNSNEATTGRSFSHFMGLNNLFVENPSTVLGSDALNLKMRNDILNDPRRFTTGSLALSPQPSGSNALPLYTYQLSIASNESVARLVSLQNVAVGFAAAGTLPAYTNTLSAYSSEIYSYMGGLSNTVDSQVQQQNLLNTTYKDKLDSVSGVNIDEELANTVLYQNAYAASARIITVVTTLFDVLLQIKQ